MRLLLDTHAFLWFVWNHVNLSAKAKSAMANPNNQLLLSMVTIWEVGLKVGVGKLTLAEPYQVFMTNAIADNNLLILPIDIRHVAELTALPFHHRDPFDRLLVAQSTVEAMPLVSGDVTLDAYGITRLW